MLNLRGSHVACEKCLDEWVEFYRRAKKFNDPSLPNMLGLPIHAMDGLIDKNANHEDVCKGCKRPLGDDRMVGGDGIEGCDVLPWRYHERCFYGAFGYID